jgi:predicted alpha/beta-hydrolase family hydrolase
LSRAIFIATPSGRARVRVFHADEPRAAMVLGHGAGGGVDAPDLRAACEAALAAAVSVALVEQPYRVAGRRSPAPALQLDEAWLAVIASLKARRFAGLPLITGGRSSGARVACRTATEAGASGVLCLAFPLVSPKGVSRQPELDLPGMPVLVIQGMTDRFGMPEPAAGREVVRVRGDHGLKSDIPAVRDAIQLWLMADHVS